MSEITYTRWLRRAVTAAAAALAFLAGTAAVKPAEAAFVGVAIPGNDYAPVPACAYYYPYGCYGYPASYYTPAAVVAGGWGWGGWGWGWGRRCWGCGHFFRDGRFFHDGRFFRDRRFFHDGRFFHSGFGGPGFAHGGLGGPGMMHGGFGGPGFAHGGAGFARGGFGGDRR